MPLAAPGSTTGEVFGTRAYAVGVTVPAAGELARNTDEVIRLRHAAAAAGIGSFEVEDNQGDLSITIFFDSRRRRDAEAAAGRFVALAGLRGAVVGMPQRV